MMSGLKLVLPQNFTDTTLPILRDDPLLIPGSLILYDLAHPANPSSGINAASGVPATGAVVNNVAYRECAALLGSGTQASLSGAVTIAGGIGNLTKGKVERTGKGGLHGIVSQSTALAAGDGMVFTGSAALRSYLLANPTHAYYFSMWDRVTRPGGGTLGSNAAEEYGINNGASATYQAVFLLTSYGTGNAVFTTARQTPSINAAGSRYMSYSITPSGLVNAPGTVVFGPAWGAPTGSFNAAALATRNTFWPSIAAYRFYLEDLTTSGRSYATVDALDFAEYTRQVLTAGGRYYADVFTDPATIP